MSGKVMLTHTQLTLLFKENDARVKKEEKGEILSLLFFIWKSS